MWHIELLSDDDDLLQRGAALEASLPVVEKTHDDLTQRLGVEKRKLARAAAKLGLNVGFGSLGIVASPLTAGLSLFATVGSGFMLVWDTVEFFGDVAQARQLARELQYHREKLRAVADELEGIHRELDSRTTP